VYVPEQGRIFLVHETQTTATQVSYPAQIRLPPLPLGWKSDLSIESAEVVD
jgi:hypothetical protein